MKDIALQLLDKGIFFYSLCAFKTILSYGKSLYLHRYTMHNHSQSVPVQFSYYWLLFASLGPYYWSQLH